MSTSAPALIWVSATSPAFTKSANRPGVGDHDLRLGVDRMHAEDEAAVVAPRRRRPGRRSPDDILFRRHARDQAGEIAGLLALRHVGEDVLGAYLRAGAEGEGDLRVLLGHFEHQVLVLCAVSDDDVVPLGDVLKDRGTGVDRLHLLAVAVLVLLRKKLFLRLENAVVHRLAPPLVVDGALDNERDLHDLGGGRGVLSPRR